MTTEHFIIAGAQRCGTTNVYHLLEQHPDICMATPVRPEPKFFLDKAAVHAGYEEYLRRHFAHRHNERVLGEKSTSYIEREEAISHIHHILPEAKLIFVFRDPVMRAWSNWRFSRAHGLETLGFEAALDAETDRLQRGSTHETSVSPFAYATRGHYARYLDRWAHHFPPSRFIILVSETIFEHPENIRVAYDRLGVSTGGALRNMGRVNASPGEQEELPANARARLREAFAQSNHELAEHWHVDVSGWL